MSDIDRENLLKKSGGMKRPGQENSQPALSIHGRPATGGKILFFNADEIFATFSPKNVDKPLDAAAPRDTSCFRRKSNFAGL